MTQHNIEADNQSELLKEIHTLVHLHHYAFCEFHCYKSTRDKWTPDCEARAKQYEDKIIAKFQAHDTKLYEQVIGAVKDEPHDRFGEYGMSCNGEEPCLCDAEHINHKNKELRTAINKIFNKEDNNG